jgi:hypothetical protein
MHHFSDSASTMLAALCARMQPSVPNNPLLKPIFHRARQTATGAGDVYAGIDSPSQDRVVPRMTYGLRREVIQMKRTLILLSLACVMAIGFAATAYANNAYFDFGLIGGKSVYSPAHVKTDGETNWYVTPKASIPGHVSTWQNNELVRFRTRIGTTDAPSSNLFNRYDPAYGTTFIKPYISGGARAGIAYHLCSDSPHDLSVCGQWCP